MSYKKMREKAGVTTLIERREKLCDQFAAKCVKSARFASWFPLKVASRATRGGEKYLEKLARYDRLRNSPLYYMRRRLNGKVGKVYGKRNGDRRSGGDSRPDRVYVPKGKRRGFM